MGEEEKNITDTEYDKILGQYRLKLNGLLFPLRMYGQEHYVNGVTEELISLAIQFHMKLSGIDMPYMTRDLHW